MNEQVYYSSIDRILPLVRTIRGLNSGFHNVLLGSETDVLDLNRHIPPLTLLACSL